MALEKIKFQTNINVEVALKFPAGKLCDSQFGDPQFMFTTTDDRVFFVAEKVAQKIHGLKLQPREPFDITKAEVDWGNGRKGIEWRVAKVGFVPGEQPDGTFALPAPPVLIPNDATEADLLRSIELVKAKQRTNQAAAGAVTPTPVTTAPIPPAQPPYNNGNGSSNGNGPLMPWALFLLSQTNMLIDVYSLACKHASDHHGNAVKNEDVRSILLSAFINVSKNGGSNVA